jgi:hypothetical protein
MKLLVTEIKQLVDLSVSESNTTRALGHVEKAKELLQELYYDLWLKYHQSGTNKRNHL